MSSLQQAVSEVWAEVLGRNNIGVSENFFDLGGDSLKALEVISRLNARLGVELPLIAFFEDPTISHLSEVLAGFQPASQPRAAEAGVPAIDMTGTAVSRVWAEVLEREHIGPNENFFDVGGDSLKALDVISRLQELLNVDVPLIAFFEEPTISHLAEVAERLRGSVVEATQAPQKAAETIEAPLSFGQLQYWLLQQSATSGHLHSNARVFRLRGEFRVDILKRAIDQLCRRHQVLSSRIQPGLDEPVQVADLNPDIRVEVRDLSSLPPDERVPRALQLAQEEWRRHFDLSKEPPLRAHVLRLADEDHLLVILIHHVVSDGNSGSIFFEELAAFYDALLKGTAPSLAPLSLQYFDYATAERSHLRGEKLENELAFWRAYLDGAPGNTALPADKPRPEKHSQAGARSSVVISRATLEGLKELAQITHSTLFSVLLSGLRVLLYRWTGERDTVIGTVTSTRRRAGTERLVGCFVNFLPFRNQVAENETALEVLEKEKHSFREAFAHQECPFLEIVTSATASRITDVHPVYNVALLLQNFPEIKFDGETFTGELMDLDGGFALLDLRFIALERPEGLQLDCEFNTEVFHAPTIENLLNGFTLVLKAFAGNPSKPVVEFEIPESLVAQAEAARRREQPCTIAVTSSFTAELLQAPLAFWMKQFGVRAQFRFAPYNQVFQQLLDPHSLISQNRDGFNIIALRLTDWIRLEKSLSDSLKKETIRNRVRELVGALQTHPPSGVTLLCLCPPEPGYDAEWSAFFTSMENEIAFAVRRIAGLHFITAQEIFRDLPVENYWDEYTDKLGHVPYTPDFFVALATTLARRMFGASSEAKKVIVVDADGVLWDNLQTPLIDAPHRILQDFLLKQFEQHGILLCLASGKPDGTIDALLAESGVLRAEHFVARREGSRSMTPAVRDLADELQLPLDGFLVISADVRRCNELAAQLPDVLTLQLPADPAEIPGFLAHTWAFEATNPTTTDARFSNANPTVARIAAEFRDVASIRHAMDAAQLTARKPTAAFVAPRTKVEEAVAAAWMQVLKVDQVGVHDNFFTLGGHSLSGTQVVARIRQLFGVEIPLRAIFDAPTVAEFSERLEGELNSRGGASSASIARISERDHLPLSFAQQRLWFLDQLDPGNPLYNMAQKMRLRGKLEISALQQAVNRMVARHEALRTTFVVHNDEPVQAIARELALPVPLVDLSPLPAPEREAEIERRVQEEARLPFNLTVGPVMRAQILRAQPEDHVLLLTMHHIVSDRWSLGLAAEELAQHYRAIIEHRASHLPELAIQYADFAVWQRATLQGEFLGKQLQYWKKKLSGAPSVLQLPADFPRPGQMSMRGAWEHRVLPKHVVDQLTALSQEHGVTLFMTLLAAFQTLMSKYSEQSDVVIGSPIAGRNFAELESLIGFFINTLALRGDLSGDPSFPALLARTKEACLQAYAHAEIPFEKLVEELQPERSLSHNPIFQVLFAHQNAPMQTLQLPGVELERTAVHPGTSILDMSWFAMDVPEGMLIRVEYSTDLFRPDTIARALEHFTNLLESIAANPAQAISQLAVLGEQEKQKLLVEFNANQADFRTDLCMHGLVEQTAARLPEADAVVCGTQRLTYRQLNERANQIAHHLIKLGSGPDVLVGVFLEREPDLLPSILGVLKSGSAYVPLDPGYPRERLAAIIADAKAPIVITQQSLLSLVESSGAHCICIDSEWNEIAKQSTDNPRTRVRPEDLGYVLFTSGSTGRPKGVALEHRSAVMFVHWAQTLFTPQELAGVLLSTSVCFDLSIFEIFVPLSVGGKVIVVQNALYLPSAEAKDEVTLINTVPSAMAELVRMKAVPRSVQTINLAGEALAGSLVNEIYEATSAEKVYNLYGPTEDTTYSTYTLTRADERVTIGRPLPNTQAYVLDGRGNPQPMGVPGELHLAGAGLARGYYGRPDLTAERFLSNPFSLKKNARMYRTGDLCRWLPDGNLEYLGRLDYQVKLRGFRIELGEIESVLGQHASVRQCLVMAREDAPGLQRLVAYIVPESDQRPAEETLREHLKRSLPEFMVPSAFVVLDAFPLSPNGKINRKALPTPEYQASAESYVAPRSPIEDVVAGIWAEVLRLPQVGVNDEFFSLGGHSLLATQVISRIRQACRVELPLRALFEAPTVAGLAGLIEKAGKQSGGTQAPPILRVARDQQLPLSFAQQRLWFLDQLEPDNPFYNIPQGLRMHGELDRGALEKSLTEIVRRHEVLRTTYKMVDGRAVQFVSPQPNLNIESIDLMGLAESERETQALQFAAKEARRPFRIDHGPVMRAYLLQLAEHEHILILNTHHVASDGWSMALYVRELSELYSAFVEGKPSPLPELPIQYADFAVWQRKWIQGETLDRHMSYWRGQLEGAPSTLELPTDRPRPAVQTFRGETRSVRLPIDILNGLKKLTQREGASLYMTLLAAFQTLLYRYTGQEDIVIGSPIANRNRAEIEDLIGFFVNALTMRTKLTGNPTFRELLGRVREVALEAYAHQDLPFEKLVEEFDPERSLGHNPLFQVLFVLQNAPKIKLDLPGLKLEWLNLYSGTAKFDLALHIAERPDGLNCMMEFNTDLFDGTTIVRMLGHYQTLLEAVIADPDQSIASFPILTPAEKQKLLVEFNHAGTSFAAEHCIHELVESQASRTPDNVALGFENQRITYRELNRRANQLAHFLQKNGVGPETLVGMCMDRSLEMVIGIVAILKAGGAYLPFDIAYPPERLAFMINDAKPPIVLTQERLIEQLPPHGARIVCLDKDWPKIAQESTENPISGSRPENLAYVIYTSGSTGKPKGCLVTHYNVVRLMQATWDWYKFDERDVWTMFHSYAFDFSVWEMWGALFYGGRVVIVPYLVSRSPEEFYKLLAEEGVTVLNQTPSSFRQLIQAEENLGMHMLALRYVVFGGEALDMQSLKPWFDRHGDQAPKLINMYGITETTVHVTYRPLSTSDTQGGSVIGQPIPDLQLYILDQHRQPVPIGIPGEMYVGGAGVARGYLNRPELTAERFIPDPFGSGPGARLYKTGDLAKYLPNGDVEYLGRIDHQVKIRGFRIELGEIESVIAEHPAVRNSVVLVREDDPGNRQLVAYVVANKQYQGEAEQSQDANLKEEQVSQWEMTFDETYSQGSDDDPEFNIIGWNSSYDGQPYPAEHMREWVDYTVERIRALKPKKLLEVGCGTGLLLLRIAPDCAKYFATDFSQRAITRLERITRERRLSQVSLAARMGDNFAGIEPDSFDTAVINSVIQYFPSTDYLMTVIEGMIKAVAPGGTIFIGDIRSLPLLEAFHAAVQLQQAPGSLATDQFAQRIRQRVAQDEELVIDPGLFHELQRRDPKVGRVEIQIKRGRHRNEMTQFRYDALLHIGPETEPAMDCARLDWKKQDLTAAMMGKILLETRPDLLAVSGIPNARVGEEVAALRLLGQKKRPSTVEQVRTLIRQENRGAVEPEDIWEMASAHGYDAEINWSASGNSAMDVIFRNREASATSPPIARRAPEEKTAPKPWSFYSNNPLAGKIVRNLVPQLRQRASDKLPEYMVPSAFVVLESLPLTENGKVDRRALPAPDQLRPELEGNYVAPRTPTEELVAGIWAEVLKLERVGVQDDFFDLGGHSLNATQVVSRVREAFKVEMPLRTLFESPTIESLARAIATMKRGEVAQEVPPIVPVSRQHPGPLSFAQQRLWFLDQMDPGSHLYNIPRAFRMTGTLDVPSLERALNGLAARHEILRTTYQLGDGDQPVQVIAPQITIELPVIDLSGMDSLRREEEARRIVQRETDRGFDLARDVILRAVLLKLAEAEHVLFINTHHIASDGWSTGVMVNDLCALYEAAVSRKPAALPPLAIQYADYSSWQRNWLQGDVLEKQLAYWKKHLAGAAPLLALPTDQERPPVQTYRGAMLETSLPKTITEGLSALGRKHGATMFMTMLAGFETLMHYCTGQNDIVLGTDLANRTTVETEALIGFFVNLLPLRIDLSGDPTFIEAINRVREVSLNAYAHQDVPFDKLVEELKPERNLSYSPLVQVLFVQQNTPRATATMPGVEMSRFKMEVQSKFDMAVFMRETGGEVASWWQYNPDLFDESTISRLAANYEAILQAAISDPKARVSSLCELLAEADKSRRGSEQIKVQKAGLEKLKKIRRKAVADA